MCVALGPDGAVAKRAVGVPRKADVIAAIDAPLRVEPTYLGAHAVPPEFRDSFLHRNEVNRDANLVTVNLNAAYFPLVEFVSAIATVATSPLVPLSVTSSSGAPTRPGMPSERSCR